MKWLRWILLVLVMVACVALVLGGCPNEVITRAIVHKTTGEPITVAAFAALPADRQQEYRLETRLTPAAGEDLDTGADTAENWIQTLFPLLASIPYGPVVGSVALGAVGAWRAGRKKLVAAKEKAEAEAKPWREKAGVLDEVVTALSDVKKADRYLSGDKMNWPGVAAALHGTMPESSRALVKKMRIEKGLA